jgi:hypothetical protein
MPVSDCDLLDGEKIDKREIKEGEQAWRRVLELNA